VVVEIGRNRIFKSFIWRLIAEVISRRIGAIGGITTEVNYRNYRSQWDTV
jgi:hypothetical protein